MTRVARWVGAAVGAVAAGAVAALVFAAREVPAAMGARMIAPRGRSDDNAWPSPSASGHGDTAGQHAQPAAAAARRATRALLVTAAVGVTDSAGDAGTDRDAGRREARDGDVATADPARRRAERIRRSPQYRDGKFHNPVPGSNGSPNLRGVLADWRESRGGTRRPTHPIPVVTAAPEPVADGLHVTWLGHATSLVEIEGRRVLLDPVWSQRCSPSHLAGPKRLHPVPYGLERVTDLDAIVISHDHYDHLDLPTVRSLTRRTSAPFLVPLGIGAHLHGWGVPDDRVVELDWDESTTVNGVRFIATPARHFSGRGLTRDGTLWCSWVIAAPTRRLFYSGDTGYFDRFERIGAEHGPFDATLMQVGAYSVGWPDIHFMPEQGVRAHRDVRGGLLIPVHWATFVLALHPWAEPVERVLAEAKQHDIRVAVPRPGQRVDVDNPPEIDGWWRAIT